jgi:hypothetical protein
MQSESYNPKACCGDDCFRFDDKEPCWGDVEVIDEIQIAEDDWGWIHACQGHKTLWHDYHEYTEKYVEELK